MATPAELAFERTDLDEAQLGHLQRLLGTWGILADLSFSDLVLMAPMAPLPGDPHPGQQMLVVLGQMRPSNTATVVQHDLVGQTAGPAEWPQVVQTLRSGEASRGEKLLEAGEEPVRLQCIPVRCEGATVAVLARLSAGAGRRPGHLERTYRDVFDRFAVMLSESSFPFPSEEVATEEAPRVGDGVVLVDEEGRVHFASPNATNALHRMGMYSQIEGRRLTDLGIEESAIEWALASALPVVEEVERRPDVTVLLHCIPLLAHEEVTGCLVLLRDVTDVRRLDRLLLSKDAAIREVHHRVKNNLQTISALLRLQARRLPPGGGRVALFEAEDGAEGPGPHGSSGGGGAAPYASGTIRVHLVNDGTTLRLEVTDDGSGLPDSFDIDASQSLGLSIVRDLVRSQLDGSITMRNRSEVDPAQSGTMVIIELPAREAQPIGE